MYLRLFCGSLLIRRRLLLSSGGLLLCLFSVALAGFLVQGNLLLEVLPLVPHAGHHVDTCCEQGREGGTQEYFLQPFRGASRATIVGCI